MLEGKKNIHFVGVGGIGMSGIALVLTEMGYMVSGSDIESNSLTKKIEDLGGVIYRGHRSSNIKPGVELVVYSSSISKNNPEIMEAHKRDIPVVQRAKVLGELLNLKKGIAVTGTHGKTTTTSLISVMLENLKLDPTVIIGGEVDAFHSNAKLGRGEYVVAEADESDGSFLHLKPLYSVITNIEMEHMDYYSRLDDLIRAYSAFVLNTKKPGMVFYNYADEYSRAALKEYAGETQNFGYSKEADIYPVDIKMDGFNTSYGCVYKGELRGTVRLKIPGAHNVLNSLAAALVGLKLGLRFADIAGSIKDFKGTKRRFHLRANADDVMLIDDYAHHPTEIRAVLEACRNWPDKRIVVIFQPHRYTRTLYLAEAFGRCFKGADKLILTDIYSASEEPIEGVSVENIYDRVKADGIRDVTVMRKEEIAENVMKFKKPGDMILVLGAGSIKDVADELAEKLGA